MENRLTNPRPRAPYETPTLACHGDAKALTLTIAQDKNKNDSIQGQNGLKT